MTLKLMNKQICPVNNGADLLSVMVCCRNLDWLDLDRLNHQTLVACTCNQGRFPVRARSCYPVLVCRLPTDFLHLDFVERILQIAGCVVDSEDEVARLACLEFVSGVDRAFAKAYLTQFAAIVSVGSSGAWCDSSAFADSMP